MRGLLLQLSGIGPSMVAEWTPQSDDGHRSSQTMPDLRRLGPQSSRELLQAAEPEDRCGEIVIFYVNTDDLYAFAGRHR